MLRGSCAEVNARISYKRLQNFAGDIAGIQPEFIAEDFEDAKVDENIYAAVLALSYSRYRISNTERRRQISRGREYKAI